MYNCLILVKSEFNQFHQIVINFDENGDNFAVPKKDKIPQWVLNSNPPFEISLRVTGYHPISASFVCFRVFCVGGGGETECLTCSLIQMGSSMAYGDNSCPQCGAKCEVWPDIVILSSSCSNYTKEILIKCFNTFDSYCTRNEHHLLLNIINIMIGSKTAEMNICLSLQLLESSLFLRITRTVHHVQIF